MPNRLKLTGILTPPSDDAFRPSAGYVKFEPADERAATWSVPGYRPAWPILGVPNAVGGALQEINGGDVYVPGDQPGDAYAGPWMRVSYELQTTAGTWHRGTYLWRAVSTGGGVIDIRTPAPEAEPPFVSRPGVPAGALLTTDVGNLVPSKTEFDGLLGQALRGSPAVLTWAAVTGGTLGADIEHVIAQANVTMPRAGVLSAQVSLAPNATPGTVTTTHWRAYRDGVEVASSTGPVERTVTTGAGFSRLPHALWATALPAGNYQVVVFFRVSAPIDLYADGVVGVVTALC